jgi:hypothetical protein
MGQLHKIHPVLAQICKRLEDCFTHLEERESLWLLDWMSKVLYMMHHGSIREKRTPKTCDWLLQHPKYGEWQTSPEPSVAWL